ncbi:MAG: serine/threonine protein kinase [Spirochaetes bacterium]|nr:serine/threonine protein kinase [Spirochaetota bacterium]MBU1079934.1 serine/threonine protein kinase [Spirochaetota bacterium]
MAELPEYIGKYKIESLVARGGMGAVLKAMHPTLRRRVVLKKLTIRGSAAIAERFKREARILMDFKHDNIVRVFDHFKEGSSHYMVLEYVDGMSLDQLIKKQRFLSSELSLSILLEASKALAYAHSMGVIHRDIKPGNILISRKGEVKLADFGIASSEEDEDSGLTREGMTLGTPCYMPPEQIENSKNVDKRADIYSMGVMLYEMVTGKKPYPGNFSADTVMMIRKGRYRRAGKLNGRIHPFVDRLIKKLMQTDPARRYQDADRLVLVLERYLRRFGREPVRASLIGLMEGSISDEPRYPRAGRKRSAIPIALAALAGLAGGGWYAWSEGYAQRWILPDTTGELRVSARIPKEGRRADELFVLARVFVDDGKDMPEAARSPVSLRARASDGADPYYTFESGPVLLAPGAYRLKLATPGAVHWESFYVAAFSAPGGPEGKSLRVRVADDSPRPLRVTAGARDAETGEGVPARVSVLAEGTWTALDDLPDGWLRTGSVRQFRVGSDGYEPQTFSLKIADDQDRLSLSASLSRTGGPRP